MNRSSFSPRIVLLIVVVSLVLLSWPLWAPSLLQWSSPEKQITEVAQETSAAPPELQTTTLEIRKHDTLVSSLLKHDISSNTAHQIVVALREAGANLRQLRPGDKLEMAHAPDGQLVNVSYAASPWVRFEAENKGNEWASDRIDIKPEIHIEARQGVVEDSLWSAVEKSGISPKVLLDFVQIFESDFDFTADTRQGDRFRFLVETRYANGQAVDQGRILAAEYISDGKTLSAVGFQDKDHFAYYDPEGNSLNKFFLRSPLQFSRISSGFTYRRPHPILGGVRPHLAIDYAAPVGTPVWAVAEGTVEFAGRKGGNGIQVMIKHRGGYRTYYNHLSRIGAGIHRGAHVGQKQTVGYVGSTGLSTGPHLDYRVSRNGTFVNPLGEKFLPGKAIDLAQREAFLAYAKELISQLKQEAPLTL